MRGVTAKFSGMEDITPNNEEITDQRQRRSQAGAKVAMPPSQFFCLKACTSGGGVLKQTICSSLELMKYLPPLHFFSGYATDQRSKSATRKGKQK